MIQIKTERSQEADLISVPAAALLEGDLLEKLISGLQGHYLSGDRSAVASIWVKRYCSALLPIALTRWAEGSDIYDPSAPNTVIVLEEHVPVAVELNNSDTVAWIEFPERLFGAHLDELFTRVHHISGLSKRVMWSNAGNVAAWKLENMASCSNPTSKAPDAYNLLFGASEAAWCPDKNPLYRAVTWVALDGPGLPCRVHRRRLCCLRHRVGEPLCYSCPRIGLDQCAEVLRSSRAFSSEALRPLCFCRSESGIIPFDTCSTNQR